MSNKVYLYNLIQTFNRLMTVIFLYRIMKSDGKIVYYIFVACASTYKIKQLSAVKFCNIYKYSK